MSSGRMRHSIGLRRNRKSRRLGCRIKVSCTSSGAAFDQRWRYVSGSSCQAVLASGWSEWHGHPYRWSANWKGPRRFIFVGPLPAALEGGCSPPPFTGDREFGNRSLCRFCSRVQFNARVGAQRMPDHRDLNDIGARRPDRGRVKARSQVFHIHFALHHHRCLMVRCAIAMNGTDPQVLTNWYLIPGANA